MPHDYGVFSFGSSPDFRSSWTSKVFKILAQYPKTESIRSIGSILLAILEFQVGPKPPKMSSEVLVESSPLNLELQVRIPSKPKGHGSPTQSLDMVLLNHHFPPTVNTPKAPIFNMVPNT